MRSALIGHSGFVGQNLMQQRQFEGFFNSINIDEIRGQFFDEVVFCGARAEKWKANANPDQDKKHIDDLMEILLSFRTQHLTLISTIDIYSNPSGVSESTSILEEGLHPYGLNRRRLEKFVVSTFAEYEIIRLPGLFGRGIKKNAIFDFLNSNQIEKLDHRWKFQFYDLSWLQGDLQRARERGLKYLNLSTEPIDLNDVHQVLFGCPFLNEVAPQSVSYDMRSDYSEYWGHKSGYLYDRKQVMDALYNFAQNYLKAPRQGA